MSFNVKPVFILSRGAGVLIESNGGLNVLREAEETQDRIRALLDELRKEIGGQAAILDELLFQSPVDVDGLRTHEPEIHALLVYFLGITPIEPLLQWKGPIIAFGGQNTPMLALYAVGEERHARDDLFIALDYEDIRNRLRALKVKTSLARTRIVLFGFPATWHLQWYAFPDLEGLRRRLGLQFIPVELRELMEAVRAVGREEADAVAQEWQSEAEQLKEPSLEDLRQSAAVYLAMDNILTKKGATAMAMNCLDVTQSRRFSGQMINPCMAMSKLRDRGVSTACEMDIPALLTMLLMEQVSEKASFLGNIVRADPKTNSVKISHCILPTRMPGFRKAPLPHILRDFHGQKGVTTFTKVPPGVTVTLARAQRNLERIVALTGKVLSCEDTTYCRHTLTVQIEDARRFIERAEGNHHVMVFGNYLDDLKDLSRMIHCKFMTV